MHNSLFLFQNKCLQKNNPPFTKKVATKQYTDSTVVLVRGLNLRLIRRLAPARMAIRYIPARLELQLLSPPRLLAPTLAYRCITKLPACSMYGYWLHVHTHVHSGKTKIKSGKICCNLKKNLGSRRPPQGRRPGAVAPPRAMVDPPLVM